ncbi:type IV secretion system protein [Paraburkholderia sp. J8-2]|uniref:type IV secretion system protein n=1 Tax=Paraburkholderia sp. J8-2 TaxID=2805440 RepID=UPI002AB7DFC9|nr:type IV secretion system protein [Paraburkholderia sp. J8-2]
MLRLRHLFKLGMFVLVVSMLVGGLAFAADTTSPLDSALSNGGSDSAAAATSSANAVTASTSCAQNSSAVTSKWSGLNAVVNALMTPITSAQTNINSAASSMAGKVTGVASALGGVLAISYVFWKAIQSAAGGGEPISVIVVESFIPAGIVGAVLASYNTLISGFQQLFSAIVSALTGGGTLSTALVTFAQNLFTSLGTAFNAAATGLSCLSFMGSSLMDFMDAFFTLLLMVAAVILAFIALAEVVGVMLTGIILVGIGTGIGPVFVACGVCDWSKNFMHTWLKFLLGGMSYTMIVSVILSLLSSTMESMASTMQSQGGTVAGSSSSGSGLHVGAALGFVGLMWVLKNVFSSVPAIASALIGHGGAAGRPPSFGSEASKAMTAATAAMAGAAFVLGEQVAKMMSASEGGGGAAAGAESGGGTAGGASVASETAGAFAAGNELPPPTPQAMLGSSGGGGSDFGGPQGAPMLSGPEGPSPAGGGGGAAPIASVQASDGSTWDVVD